MFAFILKILAWERALEPPYHKHEYIYIYIHGCTDDVIVIKMLSFCIVVGSRVKPMLYITRISEIPKMVSISDLQRFETEIETWLYEEDIPWATNYDNSLFPGCNLKLT